MKKPTRTVHIKVVSFNVNDWPKRIIDKKVSIGEGKLSPQWSVISPSEPRYEEYRSIIDDLFQMTRRRLAYYPWYSELQVSNEAKLKIY